MANRAKWLLIENLKMTESDAHHYIEKQAMDRCCSKKGDFSEHHQNKFPKLQTAGVNTGGLFVIQIQFAL